MNIPNIRLLNQQLLNPLFREPKELVSWMGAMQAQNYSMVKWAVGMRLKSATIQTVEKALREGEILRTHVMRPTKGISIFTMSVRQRWFPSVRNTALIIILRKKQ